MIKTATVILASLIAVSGVARGVVANDCARCDAALRSCQTKPVRPKECCREIKPPPQCHAEREAPTSQSGCQCGIRSGSGDSDRGVPQVIDSVRAHQLDHCLTATPSPTTVAAPPATTAAISARRSLPPPDESCIHSTVLLV